MSSFVKHYRPMNMAERQRRHDIKDLEAQVSELGVRIFERSVLRNLLPCLRGWSTRTRCMLRMLGEQT